MNHLATEKRTALFAVLVEGTSINATCRMTEVAKHTALKLLKKIGPLRYITPTFSIPACDASSPTKFRPAAHKTIKISEPLLRKSHLPEIIKTDGLLDILRPEKYAGVKGCTLESKDDQL